MRRVVYSEYEQKYEDNGMDGNKVWELVEQGEALFLGFGVDYEEFDGGPGNYSTAIIELEDGTIKNVPVQNVRFIK